MSDAGTVSTGLFLDDLSIETGALPLASPEDFEAGYGNWSIEGGNWAIGIPLNGSTSGSSARPLAASGQACAGTGINSSYSLNQDARLVSPEFVVPERAVRPELRYSYWHTFGSNDYVQLQIRKVGGAWRDVEDGRFSGSDRNWSVRATDLRPYSGEFVQIAFRLVSDSGGVSTGFFIDDISIRAE